MDPAITLSEQNQPINMRHKAIQGTHFWWPYLTWPWPWPVLSMNFVLFEYLYGSLKSIHGQTGFDPVLFVASRGDIVKRSIFDLWPDLWPHDWPQLKNFKHALGWSHRDLSNAAFRDPIRLLVWEIIWGGGEKRPPPSQWCSARDPSQWRVNPRPVGGHFGPPPVVFPE